MASVSAQNLTQSDDSLQFINESDSLDQAIADDIQSVEESTPLSHENNENSSSELSSEIVDDSDDTLGDDDEIIVYIERSGPHSDYMAGTTTNGFTIFCANHNKGTPSVHSTQFIYGNDSSIYTNKFTNEPIMEYLKIFIYNYADEYLDKEIYVDVISGDGTVKKLLAIDRLFQYVVWSFSDEHFREPSTSWTIFTYGSVAEYGSDRTKNPFVDLILYNVARIIEDYDNGVRVPNYAYKKVNDTKYLYYQFPSFKPVVSSVQNLFGYKISEMNLDVEFEKISLDKTANLNDLVGFMLKVTNTGDGDLEDLYIVDDDVNGLEFDHYSDETGKWSFTDGKWVYDGVLGVDESINLTLYFKATKTGSLVNTAVLNTSTIKDITAENSTFVSRSELKTTKVSDDKIVNLGDETTFTITVENTGETTLGDVFVEEQIPEGLSYVSYESPDKKWSYKDGKYYLDEPLNAGETATLKIILKASEVGNFTNQVTVGSNQTDNETANDTVEVQDVEDNSTEDNSTEDDSTEEDSTEEDSTEEGSVEDNSTEDETVDEEKSSDETVEYTKQSTKDKTVSAASKATGNPIMLIVLVFACLIGVRRYN